MSTLSISMHAIENAKHGKKDSSSSPGMRIDATRTVSHDCGIECYGKRAFLADLYQLVPGVRELVKNE